MTNIVGNKIPKLIHYCWFGKKPLPSAVIDCINSWKLNLPDYEIIEWNEDNFDVYSNNYVKEAYESEKYAFVTDYVRLYVLYNYGGIYMDTDVEIVRNIDDFLVYSAFSGFESEKHIPTAIMGAQQKNHWIEKLLQYYDEKSFINADGTFDLTTNVSVITEITVKFFAVKLNNKFQSIENVLTLFPKDYFCPKSYKTGIVKITKNTYAIHHFNGSWLNEESLKNRVNNKMLIRFFGQKAGLILIDIKDIYKKKGWKYLLKKLTSKVIS